VVCNSLPASHFIRRDLEFSLAWTAVVTFMWSTNAAGQGAGSIVQVWLTLFTPVFVLKAALQTWGKYVVVGSPELGAKVHPRTVGCYSQDKAVRVVR
jgi:hypothetical protein